MKPTPPGWPRLSTAIYCENAREAIAWYQRAFGFTVEMVVDAPDGSIRHSELRFGEAMIMVSEGSASQTARFGVPGHAPRVVGGVNTQNLFIYVDDVDAHCARARAAGARVTEPLADNDYGPDHWTDRTYACVDPDGHLWWFSQRLRNPVTRA
ncbi:VOC family protein [Roseateles cellulosilyticus]|uniref:VOC family protein n=1 Tax=Pelomonas cellulosilytica TaxID=2906762 RepID=A0ABS8XXD8_9BURK|nr:VOC family protein [Pelomonas sp. P8]MCE4557314.1 VOC family protein [Pelomonas sp. P8]